ncbi:YpbF family protein [Anoxybacteroides tepidamans]|nr:YpbF family protein [Anoxybacillus tepidamans]
MLFSVIEKKEKWERLKIKVKVLQVFTSVGFAVFFIYIVWKLIIPNETITSVTAAFLGRLEHLYILLLLFTSYGGILFYKNKCDKAEGEFHALRCEIIQKSADLWRGEQEWNERHKWFEIMKTKYGINLFYENS